MPALLALAPEILLAAVGGLIFCLLASLIVRALPGQQKGLVQILTAPLGLLTAAGKSAAYKIVRVFGPTVFVPQQQVGAALHDTARAVDLAAQEISAQSQILALTAQALEGTVSQTDLATTAGALTKRVGNAERQARGIGADVLPRVAEVEKGIGADVLPRIRALDRELGRMETEAIPAVQGQVRGAEHAISDLWKWVHRHTLLAASTAFAGAVVWAIAKAGASWIRCNPFQQNAKQLCRSHPGWWEDLLAGAIAIVGTVSVVEFVRDAQAVETEALDALAFFIREMPKA